MAREVAAVIGDAALRAMDEGQRALETDRREHRAERLAGLGRVDDQRLAGEVLFLIFPRLGPFANALDFGVAQRDPRTASCLFFEHLRVFRLAEQVEMVETSSAFCVM